MARKRFKAKPTTSGGGRVSGRHEVLLTSGASMAVSASSTKPVKGERTRQVARAKKAVINRLPQQEAKFREIMRQTVRAFEAELVKSDKPTKRRLDGQLRAPEVRRLNAKLDALVSEATKRMRDALVSNVEASVKTYLIGLNQASPDKIGSIKEISEQARKTSVAVYRQRVGGATASERLSLMAGRVDAELRKLIGLGKESRLGQREKVYSRLVVPKHEGKPCVSRGLARLNRTEQSRAIHKATIEALKSSGRGLAYWRLSPYHRDYGGAEICEVLATSTGPGVSSELNKLQISISQVGLYTLDDFPMVPHANCMCSIEPVF
jgi:hypothetical protein